MVRARKWELLRAGKVLSGIANLAIQFFPEIDALENIWPKSPALAH
jgi:hypothetical protein